MGWKFASQWKFDKNWVHKFPSFASPLFYSTNLRWILAFSSSTFRAFSARTWRLRSLSSIQVSSDLSSYVLARLQHGPTRVGPCWRRHQGGGAWFRQIDAAPWPSRWPCGEEPEEKENPFELFAETEILAEDCLGHESQTVFRQNLSFGEQLERVLFFFRLFAKGLATLDRAVRSHTHHISTLPIWRKTWHTSLSFHWPRRGWVTRLQLHATRDTALFTRRQCSEQKRKR